MSDEPLRPWYRGMPSERDDPALKGLAWHIEPQATWADLVLPQSAIERLHEVAEQVRDNAQAYESWDFGKKAPPKLGVTALFVGEKGSGRTLAAEVLARDLRQDFYRIHTTNLVGKYAGETEKNLRRLFAVAEPTTAVLLFDEADALFGRRSEVKDAHDRCPDVEISHLMERVQSYPGLAILKTTLRSNVDYDVLRQLRFVLEFGRGRRQTA